MHGLSFFLGDYFWKWSVGQTIAQHIHWPVLLWDIEFGENYDLLTRSNQQLIKHRTSSGYVKGGHLGTPCHSFPEQGISRVGHLAFAATKSHLDWTTFGLQI
jgi:hypothetical protein